MNNLITITGPVAAGATTLARQLAALMGWETVLEADVETTNPFFACYHADPYRYSFHNQVIFLTKSAEAHQKLSLRAQDNNVYIQDFSPFEHTGVYAYVQHATGRLTTDEYEVILRLTEIIEPLYIPPKVLVYRPLRRERLLQRVRERGRPSEQLVDEAFLDALNQRFDQWVQGWTRSPLIRIDYDLDVFRDVTAVRQMAGLLVEHIRHPSQTYQGAVSSTA